MVEIHPRKIRAGKQVFFQVQAEQSAYPDGLVPFVANQVAEIAAGLASFEKDMTPETPEQKAPDFCLKDDRLVVAKIETFHSAESAYSVWAGQHVEGNVSAGAHPEKTESQGGLQGCFGVASQVQGFRVEGVVSESIAVKQLFPLHKKTVAGPVGVVPGVQPKQVTDAVSPARMGVRGLDGLAFLKVYVRMLYVDFDAVLEALGQSYPGFDPCAQL